MTDYATVRLTLNYCPSASDAAQLVLDVSADPLLTAVCPATAVCSGSSFYLDMDVSPAYGILSCDLPRTGPEWCFPRTAAGILVADVNNGTYTFTPGSQGALVAGASIQSTPPSNSSSIPIWVWIIVGTLLSFPPAPCATSVSPSDALGIGAALLLAAVVMVILYFTLWRSTLSGHVQLLPLLT